MSLSLVGPRSKYLDQGTKQNMSDKIKKVLNYPHNLHSVPVELLPAKVCRCLHNMWETSNLASSPKGYPSRELSLLVYCPQYFAYDSILIQVDIGGHPPFPTGSKQFSGNFGNLLFLAGFNFRGHFEGLNEGFLRSRFSMIAKGMIEPPK
jgi:hypothetical protein